MIHYGTALMGLENLSEIVFFFFCDQLAACESKALGQRTSAFLTKGCTIGI
jgi:hypothetical protein